ncbi:MAG: 3-isopropylmalate dehydratase small subunit [Pseudomonadota bacterium]
MEPFIRHEGIAAPLPIDNVDTDAIIPSREMSRVSRRGLGRALFANWRYLAPYDPTPDPDFVLNQPPFDAATLLVAGSNFGCGSSREHAVWSLADFGIRVIIAPSFGAIFESNCWGNGILPLRLRADVVAQLLTATAKGLFAVDLEACTLAAPGLETLHFEVPARRRSDLMAGADAIDQTLAEHAAIATARARRNSLIPWAVPKIGDTP